MQFELLSNLSNVLYLGRDGKSTLQQHPDLANERHKPVAVGYMQPAILCVQLHQSTTCLQATISKVQHIGNDLSNALLNYLPVVKFSMQKTDINISQGSIAQHSRCGGIFNIILLQIYTAAYRS